MQNIAIYNNGQPHAYNVPLVVPTTLDHPKHIIIMVEKKSMTGKARTLEKEQRRLDIRKY